MLFFLLHIMLWSCLKVTKLVCQKAHIAALSSDLREQFKYENNLGDQIIKQLLTSVSAKYRNSSVSCRSINPLSFWLQQIIDLLNTDKSRSFAQPRSIAVNLKPYYLPPIPAA